MGALTATSPNMEIKVARNFARTAPWISTLPTASKHARGRTSGRMAMGIGSLELARARYTKNRRNSPNKTSLFRSKLDAHELRATLRGQICCATPPCKLEDASPNALPAGIRKPDITERCVCASPGWWLMQPPVMVQRRRHEHRIHPTTKDHIEIAVCLPRARKFT